MSKLIHNYDINPSYSNACRLRDYDRKHMMASCFLNERERHLLADAIAFAETGKGY